MPTPKQGYFLADGTKVPGVTTVIGRWKDSSALMQWAFQQGKSGADSLYEQRDVAADIGTMAHAMVENDLRGLDPMWEIEGPNDQLAKALQAYEMFKRWRSQYRAEVISIEDPMVSEVLRIGGTPDIALRLNGELMMGDIKTSNGIYRDYLLQVAAYRAIWNEVHPEDPMTGGFHILRFSKDYPDFEHRFYAELDDALETFKLLRTAFELDRKLKKRC